MPVISHIDRDSNKPIRKFIGTASNYRLQLAAIPDTRDPTTGQVLKGEHQVAQFKLGFFETNKPEMIKRIENAYSYGTDVKDYDVLLKEGRDRRYADLLAMAKDDPEMLERLKKDLLKKETAAQKKRAKKIQSQIEEEASPAA